MPGYAVVRISEVLHCIGTQALDPTELVRCLYADWCQAQYPSLVNLSLCSGTRLATAVNTYSHSAPTTVERTGEH